jgi:catechol 2,3-dioxygenase
MSPTAQTLAMGRVALTVHDLDSVSTFYQHVVGLHLLRADAATVGLGIDDAVLLELRRDPAARRRSPRDAGLFHTAFLLPTRTDLATWLSYALDARAPIVGASHHLVSDAVYLTDPEGNGVEIYADTPRSTWVIQNGLVEMATNPLDIDALLRQAREQPWRGVPSGTIVGHVHLQVGALAPAEAFYRDTLGLDVTCRYPGALFYAADGYHHHLATNIWNSRGAGPLTGPATGLADIEIVVAPARFHAVKAQLGQSPAPQPDPTQLTVLDPAGISLTLTTTGPADKLS